MTTSPTSTKRRTSVPPAEPASASPALDALTGGAPASDPDALERVEVPPATLTLDANIRGDLKLTDQFKASIAEHGVIVPLLCRRTPLGELLVVDGQRRLVAAMEVGLASVPVALLPAVGDDEARIWDQLVTNHGREALTAAEQANAYHQLSLMGRPAATIAKRASVPVATVETALKVATSPAASTAAAAHPALHLDDLAALAEFEDDPAVLKDLTRYLADDPRNFAHRAQRARDDRADAALIAATIAALPEGTVVLTEFPGYTTQGPKQITELKMKAGGVNLTEINHIDCPGHAVYVNVINDWDAGASIRRARCIHFCTDWKKAGHVDRYLGSSGSSTKALAEPEEAKAERRALIANNKAADSAQTVRTAWIRDLLKRKTLPADATSYVAEVLAAGAKATEHGNHTAARGFVYGDKDIDDKAFAADLARPALALRHLVALAASVVEPMPRDFWHKRSSYGAPARVAHLQRLATWGYVLSDVEQLAIDTHAKKA